jgi:hypothetical protein
LATCWSFASQVGTSVTVTTALAGHIGADLFHVAAAVFYACLVATWLLVAARTAHGAVRGRLFLPARLDPAGPGCEVARCVEAHGFESFKTGRFVYDMRSSLWRDSKPNL